MQREFLRIPYTLSILFFILSLLTLVFFPGGTDTYVMAVLSLVISGFSVVLFALLIRYQMNPFKFWT